jgi:type IV pilus assembly protein PilV
MPAKAHSTPRGFSLVEVMVALIVICVGLLGIAKLEALMLSSTGSSRLRSLVALQAASLAASMHADRNYWDGSSSYWNPASANNLTLTGTESAGSMTWSGSNTSSSALATSAGSPPTCQESTTGSAPPTCTSPQDMAAFDLNQWAGTTTSTTTTGLASVLKNSTTTIGCSQNTAANNVVTCTITITWQENTVAANSQEQQTGGSAFQTQTYSLVIEP